MTSALAAEKIKTAQHRFYIYTGALRDTYRYSVCDREIKPQTVAKFKHKSDAELFLKFYRKKYVATGE